MTVLPSSSTEISPDITKRINHLHTFIDKPSNLDSPLGLFSLQREIAKVSLYVEKTGANLIKLQGEWKQFLEKYNHTELPVKSSYHVRLDTTVALVLLSNHTLPKIQCGQVDLKINSKPFVDFLMENDKATFREGHSREFLNNMLSSGEALAIAAYNTEGSIIGGFWGFFAEHEGAKVFHCWYIGVNPAYAGYGVGNALIKSAKQISSQYDLQYATLNVNKTNPHAKSMYERNNFTLLKPESESDEKIFMVKALKKDSLPLSPQIETLVREYVLKNASVSSLAMNEVRRHAEKSLGSVFWAAKQWLS